MGFKKSSKQRLVALEPANKRPVFVRFINTADIPKKELCTHWEIRGGSPWGGGSLGTKKGGQEVDSGTGCEEESGSGSKAKGLDVEIG